MIGTSESRRIAVVLPRGTVHDALDAFACASARIRIEQIGLDLLARVAQKRVRRQQVRRPYCPAPGKGLSDDFRAQEPACPGDEDHTAVSVSIPTPPPSL